MNAEAVQCAIDAKTREVTERSRISDLRNKAIQNYVCPECAEHLFSTGSKFMKIFFQVDKMRCDDCGVVTDVTLGSDFNF